MQSSVEGREKDDAHPPAIRGDRVRTGIGRPARLYICGFSRVALAVGEAWKLPGACNICSDHVVVGAGREDG